MKPIPTDRPALIALGANIASTAGPPRVTLLRAIEALQALGLRLRAVSRFYRTPAFPPGSEPDFVNAAMWLDTNFTPDTLLSALHGIEANLGRTRTKRWSSRTIDLDLIAVGEILLPDPPTLSKWIGLEPEEQTRRAPDRLILPHPRLQDRAFVLIPLAELAPAWRHPLTGLSIAEMVAALPNGEKAGVTPL